MDQQGLSRQAYEPVPEGQQYEPFVGRDAQPAEFTWKAVTAGIFFGICFGWANAYLGLRVGLTISTSIPVAVLTVAFFKALRSAGAKTSILEANLSQTIGSASSSVASGVIFTLPALFLWNLDPGLLQMTLLAMCGGLLGVLFMVPLRRFLIVNEHGRLPYPEGTACAGVLVASDIGGGRATNVFRGLAVGALLKWLTGGLKVVVGGFDFKVPFLKKAQLGSEVSAALLGVGFILGPRIGGVMVGGGLLSWLVIIPAIAYWGESRGVPLYPETVLTITEMPANLIWTRYVRYIGAGAVATGGLITLIRSIPTMIASFKVGAAEIRQRMSGQVAQSVHRTETELPLQVVGIGVAIIVAVLGLVPQVFAHLPSMLHRVVAAVLVAIAAFFFVTVSSRIVGLVGVTSNPTSGMTIATLLATSGLFLLLGWGGDAGKAGALTVGCVVAIAASIAGDTSQDLKTGFLLGATPRRQQIGELIGVLTSAMFVCIAVIVIHESFGLGTEEVPAPQATLMKVVIEGVLEQSLPWGLVGIGVGLALVAEMFKIPSLPFAVGVYLPVSTMVPIFIGGVMKSLLERNAGDEAARDSVREQGVLFGSGLVGGEGLLGVGLALYAYVTGRAASGVGAEWAGAGATWVGVAALVGLVLLFRRYATLESRRSG